MPKSFQIPLYVVRREVVGIHGREQLKYTLPNFSIRDVWFYKTKTLDGAKSLASSLLSRPPYENERLMEYRCTIYIVQMRKQKVVVYKLLLRCRGDRKFYRFPTGTRSTYTPEDFGIKSEV